MPRKPVLAYAIGGTAAAVAAIVITASTVGLTSNGSDAAQGAQNGPAAAEVMLPDGTTGALTSWEGNEDREDEHEEHESYRASAWGLVRGEREHDDDD